jgi:hypothetical protein
MLAREVASVLPGHPPVHGLRSLAFISGQGSRA